jgi:hypothetical protein
MRTLVENGADPLFVFHNQHYNGGGGGIDVNINYEHTTILMAALGQGGRAPAWDAPPPREDLVATTPGLARRQAAPDPEIIEKVKLAVEWGVDVNFVNEAVKTCVVPWQDSFRPGERKPCDGSQTVTRRTAIESAGNNPAVVELLVANGAVMPVRETAPAGGGRGGRPGSPPAADADQ